MDEVYNPIGYDRAWDKLHSFAYFVRPVQWFLPLEKSQIFYYSISIYTYFQLVNKNAQKIKIDNIFRVTHTSNDSGDRILWIVEG
jgi:hypothetical protein